MGLSSTSPYGHFPFSIVVVAEGVKPKGGDIVIQRIVKESTDPIRLGGVGFVLGEQIEKITELETRTVVMGHLQSCFIFCFTNEGIIIFYLLFHQ